MRFWNLGKPHAFVFDETYYAKDAYALLQYGYEQDYIEKADEQILHGNLDVFADTASYVVHPPLGKWIIATGEQFFGMDPFGWRVAIAVLGTLSVLLLARLVRRVTGSTVLGTIAGFLLAIDGMHLVMSRTALLDLPVSFFLLVAFGALVLDREQGRRRAAERLDEFEVSSLGPGLGFRPWRLAAGVALGMALATKWNALFFIAAFGLLTVWWDVSARRVAGARSPWLGALSKDALPAFLTIVPTAIVTYVVTWSGWLFTSGGYHRSWGADNPSTYFGWIPNPLRSLWHYHAEAWRFHTDLTSDHAYESHPWSWLVQGRPVSFFYEEYERGEMGCEVEKCAREILGVGNPSHLVECHCRHHRHGVARDQSPRLACRGRARFACGRVAALVLLRRPQRPHDVLVLRSGLPSVPHHGDHDLFGFHPRTRRMPAPPDEPLAPRWLARTCCWRRSRPPRSFRSGWARRCRTTSGSIDSLACGPGCRRRHRAVAPWHGSRAGRRLGSSREYSGSPATGPWPRLHCRPRRSCCWSGAGAAHRAGRTGVRSQ